jgi:hypothetical protein
MIFEKGPKLTMNKKIIEHLRRFSSITGKEKTWIGKLKDNELFELFVKIKNGESARAIARHAQKVWKVNPKSSTHSISQGISKFKQRVSHLLLSPPSASDEANASGSPPEFEEESTLETMENIARQYEVRIKRMIVEEKETGVRYPFINRDLQALANLRKAILKQREWESIHGDSLIRKRRERMEENIDRRFNSLMESLGEDGRDRMIRAADRFLELAEQKALIAYRKEDGTYTFTNPEEKQKECERVE